jgi:aryl-alcohol dehydrogenase-like predicted oxidoreductase
LLTGKYTGRGKEKPEGRLSRPDWGVSERGKEIAAEVDKVAEELGCSSAQVALNWVRQQRGVVIPIVGATKPSQMKDNLGCLDFQLNQDQLKRLDEATKIDLGFPHEFLKDDEVRELIFGSTFPLIDNHRQ